MPFEKRVPGTRKAAKIMAEDVDLENPSIPASSSTLLVRKNPLQPKTPSRQSPLRNVASVFATSQLATAMAPTSLQQALNNSRLANSGYDNLSRQFNAPSSNNPSYRNQAIKAVASAADRRTAAINLKICEIVTLFSSLDSENKTSTLTKLLDLLPKRDALQAIVEAGSMRIWLELLPKESMLMLVKDIALETCIREISVIFYILTALNA
ncbi:hypothetical protein BDR26DRAFT_937568 [Obelidium mucronatum]|nr:hypothetical protein BDR26DRAFT_937568 [Obelidium mucronatum]